LGQRKNDPHQKLESLERWSARATLLILAGIVVDIGLLFWFPHERIERLGGTIANALIAVGLIIEYLVILRAIVATGNANRESDEKIAAAEARAAEANQKAQEAILELARLREKGELTADAVLATAEATRANALAAQFLLALSQQLAPLMRPGMQMPGFLSVQQHAQIVLKVKPFAGKQFDVDIDITSNALERVGLLGSLDHALQEAGWLHVARRQQYKSKVDFRGVIIEVDASKDSELLDAAATLASALNSEGIAATVNPKSETDTTNVIHILGGPMP
jgi:hypothetical protein